MMLTSQPPASFCSSPAVPFVRPFAVALSLNVYSCLYLRFQQSGSSGGSGGGGVCIVLQWAFGCHFVYPNLFIISYHATSDSDKGTQ